MKRNKMMTVTMVALALCMSLAFTQVVFASTAETFEIQVSVADVQNLYGFDFKLYYNTETLDLVEVIPELPWKLNMLMKNEVNEPLGVYRIAAVGLAPAPPFDGSATLVRLTFMHTGDGEARLRLADAALVDQSGESIRHEINGFQFQAVPVHDVAVTSIRSIPRGVYQGEPIDVTVTVKNQGNFIETFDVTLYADRDRSVMGDEYVIGAQTVVDMPGKTTRTVHFVWDTGNVEYGYYWLSAEATVVHEETDMADNILKFGDWIGGIYAPPRVRQMSNLLVSVTSTFTMLAATLAVTLGIKNYWFP